MSRVLTTDLKRPSDVFMSVAEEWHTRAGEYNKHDDSPNVVHGLICAEIALASKMVAIRLCLTEKGGARMSRVSDLAEILETINNLMCRQDCNVLTNGTGECKNCRLRQAVDRLGAIVDEILAEVQP